MKRAHVLTWVLGLCLLTIGMDLGGGFYEGFLIVPLWNKIPPQTFRLIQPQNGGINLIHFWVPVHTLLTTLLITAITMAWKNKKLRQPILIALGTYFAMRIWTFAYFIPEITAFIATDPTGASSPELLARTKRWEILSHGRTLLVAISGWFIFKAQRILLKA